MIVTCPSCAVRYLVDPHALGAKGRTVRCARCAHTWHQAAPLEALRDAPPPSAPPPQPAPPPPAASPAPAAAPPRAPAPVLTPQDRVQLPALTRPRRRWGAALVWTAAAVLLIAAATAGAIVERGRIVRLMPATAPLYALVGLPMNDAALGLVFRNVTTSREMENGLPTLVIQGEVANVSSVARPVPKLVAILRDRGEHELQEQSFSVEAAQLMPGESVSFHTAISQPAEEASGVVVTFARSGGG